MKGFIMTLTEYLTYIKKTFKREDKDDELTDALNDTLYDLTTAYDFQVKQTETAFNLTADTYSYTYPVTYAVLVSEIRYIDSGGGGKVLNLLNKSTFDRIYPDLKESTFSKGDPNDCAIYGNEIFLAPFPKTVNGEKIYISGSTVAVPLTANDSPSFEDRWREVIKFGTLYRAYSDLEEDEKMAKYLQLYQNGVERMQKVDNRKNDGLDFVGMDIIEDYEYPRYKRKYKSTT
jgi:hypothetical protein